MATLLPALKKANVPLRTIASASGTSAAIAARKYGFAQATSDYQTILADPLINTVLITTRHGSHARMVVEALAAGKHVFVEKPLALNQHELVMIQQAVASAPEQQLLVGFNRRFAPLAQQMKQLLQARSEPMSMIYTVNAGTIPADHWVHDAASGGGRIIGEGCHFIDFLAFLADSPITGVEARMMGRAAGLAVQEDKMTILLDFADGSTGVVHYFANGSKRFPKERVEVFNQGRVLVLDNFRRLQGYGWPRFRNQWLWQQDKGHAAELQAFLERIRTGGSWLIPWTTLEQVTLATFMAVERAQAAPRGISVVPCTDSER
jgi:predicted dehydrogenase